MLKSYVSLIAAGSFVLAAAPSSIGTVRSAGDFRVDGSVVRGNGTVFEGDVIETAAARSVVQMGGGQLTLAPESRAKVFHDRTVLEKGTGLLRDADQQFFEAASLRIAPAAKDSVVQVDIQGTSHIAVFALTGSALVRNSSGLLVASLHPGMALAFDEPPQTGGNAEINLSGIVTTQGGKYFLTDLTTKVTVELRGNDLNQYVGKKVDITGSVIPNATPTPPATEVVQVSNTHRFPVGGAAAAGLSTGAKIAIIGGVAIAGTFGGLAAAGAFRAAPAATNP
jgi:hypothetical protein